ncbi:hypothetical protein C2845_PM16G07450 [Panicum miliaceum]|uniref:Uncharacterized protein n=1 Tax=Panicum miliaceum TaxID=4540 RepID=A0A3L6PZB5_PANMI|nr:hypothetical protein C2845_PM16G07450 [Panicum miliaceum]
MPSEERGPKHLVSGQEPREEREQQATAPEAGATGRARGYAARGLRCLTRVSKEMSTNSAVSERGDGLGEGSGREVGVVSDRWRHEAPRLQRLDNRDTCLHTPTFLAEFEIGF